MLLALIAILAGYAWPLLQTYVALEGNSNSKLPRDVQLTHWLTYWAVMVVVELLLTDATPIGSALRWILPMVDLIRAAAFVALWHEKVDGAKKALDFVRPHAKEVFKVADMAARATHQAESFVQ